MRQNYTNHELQSILDQYSGKGTIAHCTAFTTGFENSNYLVETLKARWVIKIYEDKNLSAANVSFEAKTMDLLFRRGLLTPRVHETSAGNLVANIGSKYAILMDFIYGEIATHKSVNDSLMAEIGTLMGQMDAVLVDLEDNDQTRQNYEFDHKHLPMLEPKLELLPPAFDKGIIQQIFEEFRAILPEFNRLKHAVIHNDVVFHNILVKDGKLCAILDFNDFVCSPQVQNLAVTLCQAVFGYNWQPHQKEIFIESYCRHNPLSQSALGLLDTLIAARYAMLVVQFNFWNVTHGDDVQRADFLRDQYRFMLQFLDYQRNS